jgi:hypothetical protein
MTDKTKHSQKGHLGKPFGEASRCADELLIDLVRQLARIAADKDHKTLNETSKPEYNGGQKKGPTHD